MNCKICASYRIQPLYTVGSHTIWKCRSCQFGQICIDHADLAAFYDESYFSGEKARFGQAQHQPISPSVAYWLEHHIRLSGANPSLSIAEIGPGHCSCRTCFRYPPA